MLGVYRKSIPVFGSVVVFMGMVFMAMSAQASSYDSGDDLRDLPRACYIIFPTLREAKESCPSGTKILEKYDFWKNNFIGWHCDCSDLRGGFSID